jgi:hypothetical protein
MCHSVQAKRDTESSDYKKLWIPRSSRGMTGGEFFALIMYLENLP